jgi:hypothetical protein
VVKVGGGLGRGKEGTVCLSVSVSVHNEVMRRAPHLADARAGPDWYYGRKGEVRGGIWGGEVWGCVCVWGGVLWGVSNIEHAYGPCSMCVRRGKHVCAEGGRFCVHIDILRRPPPAPFSSLALHLAGT